MIGFIVEHLAEFVTLWNLLRNSELQPSQEDRITWKLIAHGEYTTSSAYKAQFIGCSSALRIASIWKAWAPLNCKFFAWLILQNRVWSSDRLARRGWPHSTSCPLCRMTMETAHHLLAECRYSKRVGNMVATWVGQSSLILEELPQSRTTLEWWPHITTTADTVEGHTHLSPTGF